MELYRFAKAYELPGTNYSRTEDLWTPINRFGFLSRFDTSKWPQVELTFRTAEEYKNIGLTEQSPIETRLTVEGHTLDLGRLAKNITERSREQLQFRLYLGSFTLTNHGAQISGNLHKTRFSWNPESDLEDEIYRLMGFAIKPEQGLPKDKIDEFLREVKLRRAEKLRKMEIATELRKPLKHKKIK